MAESKRAFGYICPSCGKSVYAERTEFALNASAVAVVCDCGKSELTAETDGTTFRITVPCGVCGEEHRAEVSVKQIMHGDGVGLACPKTRQLCCYIGDIYRVESALRGLETTAQKYKASGEENTFADSVIMFEVLSELRDIAQRGGISCTCGASGCGMEVQAASVDLVCQQCGGRLRVPAATDDDLDRLCCQYTLTIKGNA
ncbi:MAG: hypothetical protein IJ955_05040 [Oscillospiraceae bacterium]|nr:hypothetical protein [Oscillospiraceae bacterium]